MKILRARVIEGSLPMPAALRTKNPGMTETNYELKPTRPSSKGNALTLMKGDKVVEIAEIFADSSLFSR